MIIAIAKLRNNVIMLLLRKDDVQFILVKISYKRNYYRNNFRYLPRLEQRVNEYRGLVS